MPWLARSKQPNGQRLRPSRTSSGAGAPDQVASVVPSELEDVADKVRHLASQAQRAVLAMSSEESGVRRLHGMVPTEGTPSSRALREALYSADRALGQAADAMHEFAQTASRFASSLSGASGAGSGGGEVGSDDSPPTEGRPVQEESIGSSEEHDGLPQGFSMIPLDLIDSSDRDITAASFGKGTSPEDLVWAHQALRDVILPGLRHGMTADQFRELDTQQSRTGSRSYLTTFSKFFEKGDAIRLVHRPDGTLEVEHGYHRIWVARGLGLSHVPAWTSRVR